MIPEAVIAMLACARIGAIHSVVFGGFSSEALKTRLLDADCRLLITADGSQRGDKLVALKENSRLALMDCPDVKRVIVIKHAKNPITWDHERDVWYHDVIETVSDDCPIEPMDANAPLFILYTSGSTGKPKGVLHATGGYLVYTALTFRVVFDYHEKEVYWCTADIGWITGHSYLVYGPLLNGATTLLFEGIPSYPTYARYWNIIDKHQVNIFYTAPTALRALRREGDAYVHEASRTSLRLLGSVGEPINPEVWQWYYDVVGEARCSIVNTWWQTETGGILLTPLPGATPLVAGSAGWPFLGIEFAIVNEQGQAVTGTEAGQLVITRPWPGLMQSIYGDAARFQTYFNTMPGYYFTGDGAFCDEAGCLWITGRNDDVIKVSGHRLGTEELESALVSHPTVSEAAVVGMAHDIKGESIVAFVSLRADVQPTQELKQILIQHVRHYIGALAMIEHIQWTNALPKTRSGKIMRRILRNIANHKIDSIGDISTLAEPGVVEDIIKAFNHTTS
jgi:acetyl-CoA synthetase